MALSVLMLEGSASAQNATLDQEGRFYAGAALEISYQAGGPREIGDPDEPNASVGGSAWGVLGTLGYRITPFMSIAAEVSVPSRFRSIQQTSYFGFGQSEIHHRDEIVSGLFHFQRPSAGLIRPALVVGWSYVREDSLARTATAPDFGPQAGVLGPYGKEVSIERDTFGFTFGGDLGISLGAHVELVPQVRAHIVNRAQFGESPNGYLFLSPLVIRSGIGLRIRF